jgi:hypothetical protein
MSVMNDALVDLRDALKVGQDRDEAIAEIASEYGLKPALLTRFAANMPMSTLPSATQAKVERNVRVAEQNAKVDAENAKMYEVMGDFFRNRAKLGN